MTQSLAPLGQDNAVAYLRYVDLISLLELFSGIEVTDKEPASAAALPGILSTQSMDVWECAALVQFLWNHVPL